MRRKEKKEEKEIYTHLGFLLRVNRKKKKKKTRKCDKLKKAF